MNRHQHTIALRWAKEGRRESLQGFNLHKAELIGVDLREADLRDVDLSHAELWGAKLREADLRNANLTGAELEKASISRSKFGVFGYFQSRLQGFWSHVFRFRLQKTTYFISENRPNLGVVQN